MRKENKRKNRIEFGKLVCSSRCQLPFPATVMLSDSEESIRLDQEIANRLQSEHPEQYVTLVRMHLSFELDLNTDTE